MKKLGSKGFTISPFFLIALILLGTLLAGHFQETDARKQKAIVEDAAINREAMNVEESSTQLQSLLLLVSYQAVFEENKEIQKYLKTAASPDPSQIFTDDVIKKDLETKIQKEFNSATALSFTVTVDNSKPLEGFTVTAKGQVADSQKKMVPVTLEKFVNARIFLLNSKMGSLQPDFSAQLKKQIECHFSSSACSITSSSGPTSINCNARALNGQVLSNSVKDPEEIRKRLITAVVEAHRKIAVDTTKNKDDTVTTYEIQDISARITPSFTQSKDKKADNTPCDSRYCCKCVAPVKDPTDPAGKRIKTPGYCATPDYDYSASVDLTGSITINSNIYDHAKIADDGNNFKVCTTSPIMVATGEIVPLELGYQFTIPVNIRITYTLECKSGQFSAKQTSGKGTYPVYAVDSSSLKFTTEPVKCSSGISGPNKACENILVNEATCSCGV